MCGKEPNLSPTVVTIALNKQDYFLWGYFVINVWSKLGRIFCK